MIAHLLPALTARLAAAGDVSSMLEMANEANTGKEDGIGWLRAAVSKFDAASNDEKMTLSQYGCAKHQLLQKLAEMLVDAGKRAEASEGLHGGVGGSDGGGEGEDCDEAECKGGGVRGGG